MFPTAIRVSWSAVLLALLIALMAAIDASTASAAAPRYRGSATMSGDWQASEDGGFCPRSSEGHWQYSGTFWPTQLDDSASLDARTRTGGGTWTWTDSCDPDFSGTCSLQVETPPEGHFAGYEDFNFFPANGGLRVGFQGDLSLSCPPGTHGPYGPGGFWPDAGAVEDPSGFIPQGKIGDAKITVPISGTYSHSGQGLSDQRAMSGTLTLTRIGDDLRADPGGPYTVRRANRVRLDGSRSKPRREITDYRWKFQRAGGDCGDVQSHTGARKEGRVTNVVALCGLKATLTVVGRDGERDSASTVVRVLPRGPNGWRTPFRHRERTGDRQTPMNPPSATSAGEGNYAFSFFGGLNVSDCGALSPDEILCPPAEHHSWLGGGYELAKVEDPNGPFDGFSYVASSDLSVKRAALINPTILPGSTFYQHNLAAGRDVAGFLSAIRQHEGMGNGTPRSGHSLIMKSILQTPAGDARRVIEPLFAPGREGARREVDRVLNAIDTRLDNESDDPLSDIWTGEIDFFDSYQGIWVHGYGFRIPGNMRG